MFPVIAAIPCMIGVANSLINKLGTFNGFSKRKIFYFATCFCLVLALILLALSFSFLISLLTNFSSGVSNALKALDRAFLTFCCLLGIATRTAGKQKKMMQRRLPCPRKRVGERERFVYWASLLRVRRVNKTRLPGPRKRVGERVHTYSHARTKTISRPN